MLDAEQLIAEVADTIAELQGVPASSDRCLEALDAYLADRSEENRSALREAYLSIPEHLRAYVLGDQDMADWPLRVLVGELGEIVMPRFPPFEEQPITPEQREAVFRYFETRKSEVAQWREETNADDPDGLPVGASGPSIGEGGYGFADGGGWVDMSGTA